MTSRLATQLGEAMAPYTRQAAETYSKTMLEFMAAGRRRTLVAENA
jgi:hypothetical protein